jgi:hypothetical protein
MEGSLVFRTTEVCTPPLPPQVLPLMEYGHSGGRCAVTGGYRFRGPIPVFQGMYVFADSCSSEIFFAKPDTQGQWSWSVWRDDANGYGTYSGFGEDEAGNLYVANTASEVVYRFHSDQGVVTHVVTPHAGPGGTLDPATPQSVAEGATVAFDVQPIPGYAIAAVDGCDGALVGSTFTTAPVAADCDVTATFAVADRIFADGFEPSARVAAAR